MQRKVQLGSVVRTVGRRAALYPSIAALWKPFTLLRRSPLLVPLYTISLIAVVAFVLYHLEEFSAPYIGAVAEEFEISAETEDRMWQIVHIVCFLPLIPAVLTAVFLPIRLFWIQPRVTAAELADQSRGAMRRAGHTTLHVLCRLVYLVIPLGAVYLFYESVVENDGSAASMRFIYAAAVVAGAFTLIRALPAICAPAYAVLCEADPPAAFGTAREVTAFQPFATLLGLTLSAALTIAAIWLADWSEGEDLWIRGAALAGAGFLSWYGLSYLGSIFAFGLARHAREHAAAIRHAASSEPILEASPESPLTAGANGDRHQQPIYVHIEKLVMDERFRQR